MVELKPVLQVLLLILGSMAAAWAVVQIRDQLWPRPVISILYDNQVVFERAEQAANEIETAKAQIRQLRTTTESTLLDQQLKSEATIDALGDFPKTESN